MKCEHMNLSELKGFLDKIFKEWELHLGDEIDLTDYDFYWSVKGEDAFDAEKKPEKLFLGQLTDDIAELNRLVDDVEDIPVSHDLLRLAAILKAMYARSSGVW